MPPLAVFDLDGTLVDSAPDIHAALDRLMARLGRPGFARAEVTRMIGDGVRVLVQRACAARDLPFGEAALAAFTADYTAHAAAKTRPFAGIPAALAALEAAGWRFALCTNKPVAATEALLAALALPVRFAAIGGGDSFPTRKPDPAHLLATVAAAGGTPDQAVMIGDHRNDVAAAIGAGMPALFAAWGYGLPEMAAGAAAIAERPAALPALLAEFRQRRG
ncbi:phosphoglycolate phosphatase [Siccirubricoccus sp. KC 17139]|uniref:Phosphoglycolate phosphatase n=1 Tax=Siccirubricoccus soli TaxID=2899147 RepID=A0ABT1D3W6_9PROT|nr:phosphoglycolate phosphatase [Siccirubricoccus soli]MCO6416613.1 phosphoglycolate phosphatase [Siccirubricoccus soli]MCP2682748.1 phosphoglycolate phosphatase [Siccirubricoccus soli]